MTLALTNQDFKDFIAGVGQNEFLISKFKESPHWNKGGKEAFNLVFHHELDSIPDDALRNLQTMIEEVCVDTCQNGCAMTWNDRLSALLNENEYCEACREAKNKLETSN